MLKNPEARHNKWHEQWKPEGNLTNRQWSGKAATNCDQLANIYMHALTTPGESAKKSVKHALRAIITS